MRRLRRWLNTLRGDRKRCRYSDCPEGHPVIPEADEDRIRVSCDTCRKDMGLPSIKDDCLQNHEQPCPIPLEEHY